jgi:hypothetical protein
MNTPTPHQIPTLLQAHPHANENPQIPNSLLDGPTDLLAHNEPFNRTVDAPENAPKPWNKAKMPQIATCEIAGYECVLLIHNSERGPKQMSLSGSLSGELPKISWPDSGIPAQKARTFQRKAAVSVLAIPAFVLLSLWLWTLDLKISYVWMTSCLAAVCVLAALYYTILKEWMVDEAMMFRCPRPDLGPKTKELMRDLALKGWKELHLVWNAENNWRLEGKSLKGTPEGIPATYESTEILVVGVQDYDQRVVARIADRTL